MSESTHGIIVCDSCGRRFKWKPELAGKHAKCLCGQSILIPAEPPEDDLYSFAEPEPPKPTPRPIAQPVVTASVGSAPVVNYRAPGTTTDRFSPEKLRDLHAPLVLIGIGVFVQWVAAWLRSSHTRTALSGTLIYVTVEMVISTAFMLIAVFIAARLRQIQLGKFWSAILKLAAVSVAPSAIVKLLYPFLLLIPFFGWLVGDIIEFCLFFALLGYFFDMDESDTWFCVIVMIIVSITITLALPLILARV